MIRKLKRRAGDKGQNNELDMHSLSFVAIVVIVVVAISVVVALLLLLYEQEEPLTNEQIKYIVDLIDPVDCEPWSVLVNALTHYAFLQPKLF